MVHASLSYIFNPLCSSVVNGCSLIDGATGAATAAYGPSIPASPPCRCHACLVDRPNAVAPPHSLPLLQHQQQQQQQRPNLPSQPALQRQGDYLDEVLEPAMVQSPRTPDYYHGDHSVMVNSKSDHSIKISMCGDTMHVEIIR